jgi:hypothetical protein
LFSAILGHYEYPEHPNQYDPVTIRTAETYQIVHHLAQLIEYPRVIWPDFICTATELCSNFMDQSFLKAAFSRHHRTLARND